MGASGPHQGLSYPWNVLFITQEYVGHLGKESKVERGWGEVKGGNAGSGVFGSPGTAGDAY